MGLFSVAAALAFLSSSAAAPPPSSSLYTTHRPALSPALRPQGLGTSADAGPTARPESRSTPGGTFVNHAPRGGAHAHPTLNSVLSDETHFDPAKADLWTSGAALTVVGLLAWVISKGSGARVRDPVEGQEYMAMATMSGGPTGSPTAAGPSGVSISLVVAPEDAGTRLDVILANQPGIFSRTNVQRAVKDGGVLLNGVVVTRGSVKANAGDEIQFHGAAPEDLGTVEAEDIGLTIHYEDDDCIVVEKPAGMVVHPAKGNRSGTLVNALLHHVGYQDPLPVQPSDTEGGASDAQDLEQELEDGEEDEVFGPPAGLSQMAGLDQRIVRPGIVHRLDKGTSGVMVVAKNDTAHLRLAAQFAERTSDRSYLALCWGVPSPPQGRLATTIGRDPRNRLKMAVVPEGKGKSAVSTYRVVEALDGGRASLVQFKLHTGRTHQVRVHAQYLGHPILGDDTYGGTTLPQSFGLETKRHYKQLLQATDRPMLHAYTLGFTHPTSGERLDFRSDPPEDLKATLRYIRDLPVN